MEQQIAQKQDILFLVILIALSVTPAGSDDKPFIFNIGPEGVQRIEIVAGSYFFKPNFIAVKAGLPVEITIRKEPSVTPHDFVWNAPEAGIKIKQELSENPVTASFTLLRPGKYEFYCDKKLPFMKSHRENGMRETLEIY